MQRRGKGEGSGFSGSRKWLGAQISPPRGARGRSVETGSSRVL